MAIGNGAHSVTSASFAAWDLRPLSLAEFRALEPSPRGLLGPAQLEHLLGFALLAPTAHNSVPQAYRLEHEGRGIGVYLRQEQVLSASDRAGRQAVSSVGAALENLTVAARCYGLSLTFARRALQWSELAAGRTGMLKLGAARVAPTAPPSEATRSAEFTAMLERRVVRAEYNPAEPLPDELRALLRNAAEGEEVELHLFETAQQKFSWAKHEELALKSKLEDREFRTELGGWLLPNDDDWSRRGMRGREFGLDDARTRAVHTELLGETPPPSDRLTLLARAGRAALQSSSAIGVVSAKNDTVGAALLAGRVLERCLLLAWQHGFAHAIHTSVCEMPHVRAMSRATLLAGRGTPLVVFRLGKPRNPNDWQRPHSSRPPASELIAPSNAGVFQIALAAGAAGGRTPFALLGRGSAPASARRRRKPALLAQDLARHLDRAR